MAGAETQAIEIVVNGNPRRVPQGLNVAGLLVFLDIDRARVAVELNGAIVRQPDWESAAVAEGAR